MLISSDLFTESLPLHNGFNLKFGPISNKEEVNPKEFGNPLARIPQEFTEDAEQRRKILKSLNPASSNFGTGCTNQLGRIIFPYHHDKRSFNDTQTWDKANFINLPFIKQPYNDYKIIVATAPPHIKMGRGNDAKPMVIYVVFSDDGDGAIDEPGSLNIPSIYFVNKPGGVFLDIDKKEKVEPLIIIDNNRMVTGLRSKNVAKKVNIKKKIINLYSYQNPN